MEEKREEYEHYWVRRTQFWAVLTILSGCLLMGSVFFFVNFTGIVAGVFAFLGAKKRKSEFLFVSFVLLIVEFLKNLAIIYFLLNPSNELTPQLDSDSYPNKILYWTQECLYFVEDLVILPCAIYAGFFLYKTLSADTIFQSEAWSNA